VPSPASSSNAGGGSGTAVALTVNTSSAASSVLAALSVPSTMERWRLPMPPYDHPPSENTCDRSALTPRSGPNGGAPKVGPSK
jgi:hypothetical protein